MKSFVFRSEVVSSLFSATKASQQAILLVRALCEKACSSITGVGEGEDGICLLHIDPQTTFTLKEFVDAQTRQAQDATEKLTALRVKVLEIVKEACEVGKLQECEKHHKISSEKLQGTLQLS